MLKRFSMVVTGLFLVTLALVGCRNGLLDTDDATVNGRMGVYRTATITVTNFAPQNSGMSRSIVADPLKLTDIQVGHTLVVSGTRVRGPAFPATKVNYDAQGKVTLPDLDADTWTLKFTLYEDAKAGGAGGFPATIDPNLLKDAEVLVGYVVVDLTQSNASAPVTLTSNGVGTKGNVELEIRFDTTDWDKMKGVNTHPRDGGYTVTVGIYDRITDAAVSDVVLAASTEDDFSDRTNPQAGNMFTADVAPGVYNLKVKYVRNSDKKTWVWTDEIHVEGNRETTNGGQPVVVSKLFDEVPKEPTGFNAYYDPASAKDGRYTVDFRWTRQGNNESGFEIQILNITQDLDLADGRNNVKYKGTRVTDATTLWQQIDQGAGGKNEINILTPTTFAANGGAQFPVYVADQGTLNAGSTNIDFEFDAGSAYAVRIRAINTEGKSNWTVLGIGNVVHPGNQPGGTGALTEKFSMLVAVSELKYNLNGFRLVKENAQVNTVSGTERIPTYVQYAKFDPALPVNLTLPVATHSVTLAQQLTTSIGNAGQGRYFLYQEGSTGNSTDATSLQGFNGWKASTLVHGQPNNVPLTNEYFGIGKHDLTPSGVSSSSGSIEDIITAGVFANFIQEGSVWLDLTTPAGVVNWNTTQNITTKKTGTDLSGAAGRLVSAIGRDGTNNLVIELHLPAGQALDKPELHINVGKDNNTGLGKFDDNTTMGTLKERVADGATYSLERRDGSVVSTTTVTGATAGKLDLSKIYRGGNYVLRVRAQFGKYSSEKQFPVIIKFTDEAL